MRLSITLSALALLSSQALAALQNVTLWVESDNSTINGNGLSSLHEGAGINYVFLGQNAQTLIHDDVNNWLYFIPVEPLRQYFAVENNIAQVTVAFTDNTVTFENGYLSYGGSTEGFYALLNINDPYNYSKTQKALVHYPDGAPEGAIPLKIRVQTEGEPVPGSTSSTEASSSAAPTTLSTTEVPTTLTSVIPTLGYPNSTVTKDITYTEWVTTCPEATTITITTCTKAACQPATVTFTGPTTATFTGPKPSTTVAAESRAPTSTPAPSVVPQGGASGNTIKSGLAGFAAVAVGLFL
ncbi:uncharacterized protein RJT20DRAFT_131193 [Scheffersomyces xylosifermentans]|uniref:uncharacterized protein n=1 Tax=Scheffersomyces xylosifermentans TaxID=1304137 RepID=UPI00315CC9AA